MILVTGASGHLGNVLVRELLAAGRPVRAMVHSEPDPASLRGLDVQRVRADVTTPYTLAAAVEGVDAVVHLASLVSIGEGSAQRVEQVNVEGTRAVLAAARAAGVRRLLYVGSVHALEHPAGGQAVDEHAPLVSSGPVYERSKAAATRLALAETDLDVVVAHPSGVLGPWDFTRSELGCQIRRWALSGTAVTVAGGYDLVDVRDVAVGLTAVLDRGRRGESYLLGGRYVALSDLAREVVGAAGRRARVLQLPTAVALPIAQAALATSRLRRGKAAFTPYAVRTLAAGVTVDSGRARAELGWSVRPWAETVADTTRWWLEHPQLGAGKRPGSGEE